MGFLMQLFYSGIAGITIIYAFVKYSLSYWKRRGILHEKPIFLWGNLKGVGNKYHISVAVKNLYEKYKDKAPFIGFYTLLKPMVLVLDMNLVRNILKNDSEYFIERGLYNNVNNDPLSENLIQLDGDKWKELRDKLKLSFSEEKISTLMLTLEDVAKRFQRSLSMRLTEQNNVIVINELVACYNEDVLSALVFGMQGDSLQYSYTKFRQMSRHYQTQFSLVKTCLAFNYPCWARLFQYRSYDQIATDYFIKMASEKAKEHQWNRSVLQTDFLKLFAELRKPRLDGKQIASQCFSFILAGLEACNSTLTFGLYELSLNLEMQQKARAEIRSTLKRHGYQMNLKCINEMTYLKQILNETLRKHSPYAVLLRNTTKDYEIPNSVFMFQKGNHTIIPISAIHHNAAIYPEPERFDPERFTAKAIDERPEMSFLPFGFGLRNCIAQQFAEIQMLVGFIILLNCYEFSPCAETQIPIEYDKKRLILAPKCDIKLSVIRV